MVPEGERPLGRGAGARRSRAVRSPPACTSRSMLSGKSSFWRPGQRWQHGAGVTRRGLRHTRNRTGRTSTPFSKRRLAGIRARSRRSTRTGKRRPTLGIRRRLAASWPGWLDPLRGTGRPGHPALVRFARRAQKMNPNADPVRLLDAIIRDPDGDLRGIKADGTGDAYIVPPWPGTPEDEELSAVEEGGQDAA